MGLKNKIHMFELYSVLRYYPIGATQESHYTATILEEGVWQIKGETGNHTMYSTVESWLQSLPGTPDASMLEVTTNLVEKQKQEEEKRIHHSHKNATKKKKWNVPSKSTMPRSLPWAYHIYSMIKECSEETGVDLLTREDMRNAYNHLVHVLTQHNDMLRTTTPYRRNRYQYGIDVEIDGNSQSYSIDSVVHMLPTMTYEEYLTTRNTIYQAYLPLMTLLKENVIPFMERKFKEKCNKCDMIIYRRKRDMYVNKMMKLTKKYEEDAAYLRNQMERYQSYMDHIEQNS